MESDWDHVTVIRKNRPTTSTTTRSQSAINEAKRTGVAIAVEKKHAAGHNKTGHQVDLNAARLDRETEELKHKTVSPDVGKAIMKARQEKGLTQKDLAVKINEKPQVVAEYEQAKALPNQQILGKLERALGVKLRGKGIGEPLAPRGQK